MKVTSDTLQIFYLGLERHAKAFKSNLWSSFGRHIFRPILLEIENREISTSCAGREAYIKYTDHFFFAHKSLPEIVSWRSKRIEWIPTLQSNTGAFSLFWRSVSRTRLLTNNDGQWSQLHLCVVWALRSKIYIFKSITYHSEKVFYACQRCRRCSHAQIRLLAAKIWTSAPWLADIRILASSKLTGQVKRHGCVSQHFEALWPSQGSYLSIETRFSLIARRTGLHHGALWVKK